MRLIDADKLLEFAREYNNGLCVETAVPVEYIEGSATVEHARCGHWRKSVKHLRECDCDIGVCSVCGNEEIGIVVNVLAQNPYCRRCGAKMDDKEKEL